MLSLTGFVLALPSVRSFSGLLPVAAVVSTLAASSVQAQTVKFFIDDLAGWQAVAGGAANVDFFEMTGANLALANELSSPPSHNTNLSTRTLTFASTATPIAQGFVVNSVDAPTFHYWELLANVWEGLVFNPLNADTNDFDVTFSGAPLYTFGVDLLSSDLTAGETLRVFGSSGEIGSTSAIPNGGRAVIFLGVASTEPITRVYFDENGQDGDNIAVGDLRFGRQVFRVQPDLGFQGPGAATATLCGTGLNIGESSVYGVMGAQQHAAGALLVSLPNMANVTLFPAATNPGTLVSGAGIAGSFPIVADVNGNMSLTLPGLGTVSDLVFQSLFVDSTVPGHNVAFTNAVLAQFGQ